MFGEDVFTEHGIVKMPNNHSSKRRTKYWSDLSNYKQGEEYIRSVAGPILPEFKVIVFFGGGGGL